MIEKVKEWLGLSGHKAEQDRRIAKKTICENDKCSAADARLVERAVESVRLIGLINEDTSGIPAYRDDTRRYEEAYFLLVELRDQGKAGQLGELLDRLMPNPLLMVMTYGDQVQLQTSTKRLSLSRDGETVVEDHYASPWRVMYDWLAGEGVAIMLWSHKHLLAFMTDAASVVLAARLSEVTGADLSWRGLDGPLAVSLLGELAEAERVVASARVTLDETLPFGDRVTANVGLKRAEEARASIIKRIQDLVT